MMRPASNISTIGQYIASLDEEGEYPNSKAFIDALRSCYTVKFKELFKDKPLEKSDEIDLPLRRALFQIYQLFRNTLGDPHFHVIYLSRHSIEKSDAGKVTPGKQRDWEGFDDLEIAEAYVNDWVVEIDRGEYKQTRGLRSFRCFEQFFTQREGSFVLRVGNIANGNHFIVRGDTLESEQFVAPMDWELQNTFEKTIWAFSHDAKECLVHQDRVNYTTELFVMGIGTHMKPWPNAQLSHNDPVNSTFIAFSLGEDDKDNKMLMKAAAMLGEVEACLLQALNYEAQKKIQNQAHQLDVDAAKYLEISGLLRKAEKLFDDTRWIMAKLNAVAAGDAHKVIRFADEVARTLFNESINEYSIAFEEEGKIVTMTGTPHHNLTNLTEADASSLLAHARLLFGHFVSSEAADIQIALPDTDPITSLHNIKEWLIRVFSKRWESAVTIGTLALITKHKIVPEDLYSEDCFIRHTCQSGIQELFSSPRLFLPAFVEVLGVWADNPKIHYRVKAEGKPLRKFIFTKDEAGRNAREFNSVEIVRSLAVLLRRDKDLTNVQLGNLSGAVMSLINAANPSFTAMVSEVNGNRVEITWFGKTRAGATLKCVLGFEEKLIDFCY